MTDARDVIARVALECFQEAADVYDTADTILTALQDAGVSLVRWRPIEEAPKDGTKVLILWNGEPFVAFFGRTIGSQEEWQTVQRLDANASTTLTFGPSGYFEGDFLKKGPTHFAPLPTPPKEGKALKDKP